MRRGRRVVSEWLAALCSCSGATTQTSADRSRAISSNNLMPGDPIPSSLVTRTRALASSMRPSAMRFYDLLPSHIGLQRPGQRHRTVMTLEVFEDRDQGPADRQTGAVQRVHGQSSLAAGGTIARLHTLRLEPAAIRAARNLAIGPLPRQPDLDIVGFLRRESHVAGRQHDDTIRKAKPFQHFLRAGGHPLVLGLRIFGASDRDELDLFELMLADHAAGVLPRRAGLRAEARGPGGVAQRQSALVEDLSSREIGERHFGGRDQPIAVRGAELVRRELRELAGPEQRFITD